MNQKRHAGHLMIIVLVVLLAAGCTTYRYTRAFYLPDQLPEEPPEKHLLHYSIMPEKFESWLVMVRFSGLYNTNDARWISENRFTHIQIRFLLPEDTLGVFARNRPPKDTSEGRPLTSQGRYPHDTIDNRIMVDSVQLTLEPHGKDTVLYSFGSRDRHPKNRLPRIIYYRSLCLPEEVEEIDFRFTARMVDPEGTEISRKEFSPRLVLWEDKWLDKEQPDIHALPWWKMTH